MPFGVLNFECRFAWWVIWFAAAARLLRLRVHPRVQEWIVEVGTYVRIGNWWRQLRAIRPRGAK